MINAILAAYDKEIRRMDNLKSDRGADKKDLSAPIIYTDELTYEYEKHDEEGNITGAYRALDGIDLKVKPGEFIAILGHNGSGKSTLAKHINAILTPSGGSIYVNGKDTRKEENTLAVRQTAGMVFQNPDNQIIGTVVEEDVGFGPENLGIPTDEILSRVVGSLSSVGMLEYRYHSPNKLSGGQKQRVAIAGVIAMRPKCIVLDEPTAMLDPSGRLEVLNTVEELRQKEHVTVILITHYMEEVVGADRVIVMDKGHIVMNGSAREVFSKVEQLRSYRLDVPQATLLAYELKKRGYRIPDGILTIRELTGALCSYRDSLPGDRTSFKQSRFPAAPQNNAQQGDSRKPILRMEHVRYVYSPGNAYEKVALDDICLDIYPGEFVGIIGHTGSGKSTLIQHLNGLLKANGGAVYYNGTNIYGEKYDLRQLRNHVGLVFQYPEHQLFETDVLSDVCFGPKNQGLSKDECVKRAREAMRLTGLLAEYEHASPFELSGGQKRRAAIAGVLAMHPDVLILDEPTAGLDPRGRDEILDQIAYLQKERKITVVLVSHSMEDIAKYVGRIVVMNHGAKLYDGAPRDVFSHYKELEKIGLSAPRVTYVMHELLGHGIPVREDAITIDEAVDSIMDAIPPADEARKEETV